MNLSETSRIKREINARPADFASIIETTTIGICITDEEGNYRAVNDAYTQILGYAKSELIGKNFLMVVPKEKKEDLRELHDQFIEAQVEMFDRFRVVNKAGELVDIHVDAGFSDKILDSPHKITFIQRA